MTHKDYRIRKQYFILRRISKLSPEQYQAYIDSKHRQAENEYLRRDKIEAKAAYDRERRSVTAEQQRKRRYAFGETRPNAMDVLMYAIQYARKNQLIIPFIPQQPDREVFFL